MSRRISRRTVLRGLGVSMALPWLEAMGPVARAAATAAGAKARTAPNRMAFLYVPNGVNMADWTPKDEGVLGDLPSILKPLEKHKRDFSILTGLTADKARSNGDGGGDHARALSAFLTGAQPRKTDGTDIRAGVSVDQVAVARVGERTHLPSLEIGIEQGSMAGNCDSGYSCVYSSTMAWRSATQPLPKETNPQLVFERLFAAGDAAEKAAREARRKSVLDFVLDDARALEGTLGANDRRKLDEYLSSVRDIESRIDRADKLPPIKVPNYPVPTGKPADKVEHIRLMCDLVALAFEADVTRVVTFVLANEGSNASYPMVDVTDGHHSLSHHGNDPAKKQKIARINTFHTTQLAYLLERLKGIREGEGTLLDHSMIAYGSANSDGNRHNHDDLPVLLAGGGCGTLKPGRHLRYSAETPVNNLWLSMLERMEVKLDRLGDGTGTLKGLTG